jgi:hypothetical protein
MTAARQATCPERIILNYTLKLDKSGVVTLPGTKAKITVPLGLVLPPPPPPPPQPRRRRRDLHPPPVDGPD